ncbi:unnamed protein product [Effrenium voratum]|nr:unnamed protein product [Effrenium voratum]
MRQEPGAISMHSDGGVAKTDMAIREGMLQQRPTRVCAKAASFPIGAPQAWTRQ